jgi:uncharacterized protein (UPF0371 family)
MPFRNESFSYLFPKRSSKYLSTISEKLFKTSLERSNENDSFIPAHITYINAFAAPGFIFIALSICAATNPTAALALQQLTKLRGCEAHSSVILSRVDENVFQKLGVNITCEPQYQTKKLYHQ